MSIPLGKGILLVAAPALNDPNFRQTVVLLCEHGPEGALGVIVNRPTAMSISEALPQVPILEGQPHVLYSGGPVQTNQVMMLYRINQTPENSHQVVRSRWRRSPTARGLAGSSSRWGIRAGGPASWSRKCRLVPGSRCLPIPRLCLKKNRPAFGRISSSRWTTPPAIMRICRSIPPATRQLPLSWRVLLQPQLCGQSTSCSGCLLPLRLHAPVSLGVSAIS